MLFLFHRVFWDNYFSLAAQGCSTGVWVEKEGFKMGIMCDFSQFLYTDVSSFLPFSCLSFEFSLLLLHHQVAEGRQEELTQRGAMEKKELELRIEEMEEKEQVLQARIEALQADNDFTNERLAALQGIYSHARTQSCPATSSNKPTAPLQANHPLLIHSSCHSYSWGGHK